MAEGIKTFGKKGQKAEEILDRIKTPTDKAVGGSVSDVLEDFVKDSNAQLLGAFFGSMITGTKMNKGAFDGMMSNIAKNNIFVKISGILNSIFSELSGEENTIKNHIVKMSESIKTISDNFFNYLAMSPQANPNAKSSGNMSYNIILDTTKASDFDRILKEIVALQPENVKNVEKLFNAASQISYIDMKSLKDNFIDPLNALQDLKYNEIISISQELVNSDMFVNLQDVFSALSGISFDNQEISGAFEALDTFTSSLTKYNELDLEGLKILPEKIELIASIFSEDNASANLKYIFDNINNIGEIDSSVYASVDMLAVMTAHLLLFSDGLDQQSCDEIIDSIKNLDKIIVELSNLLPEMQKNGEAISTVLESYNNNIDTALANSESANEKMSKLVSNYNASNEKIKEARSSADGLDFKEISATFSDLGVVIALMGATMLIGGYIVTKNQDILAGSFKFAVALTAFMTMVLVPIVITNIIYGKMGVTQQAINGVTRLVTGMALIMIIGGLVYSLGGLNLSKNAFRFAKDLGVFLTLVLLPIALISLISRSGALKQLDEVGKLIIKAALVMIIGALIVNNDALVKSSLKFGIVLGEFIFLTLLPIMIFGAIVGKDATKYIKDIGIFVVTCSIIMLLGALFMSDDKLWKQSLMFGVLLMAFVGLVLLPFVIFGGLIESKRTQLLIKSLTGMIISFSLILMVGGLFMTWGNGKYAMGARKFALLVFLFTAAMVLTIAIVSLFMNEKAVIAIRQFTKMVTLFATLLIVGALFMMVPGFPENAVMFAGLLLVFTALMGIVFVLISKFVTKDALISIGEFGVMVFLLSLSLILGGLTVKLIGIDPILEFAAMIGVMLGVVLLYVKLTSKINPAQMALSMGVMLMFSISIAILAGAFLIAKYAVRDFTWEDYGKLFALVGGFVVIFALVGIPYVVALVGTASVAFILMGAALTSLSIGIFMVHTIVSGFDKFDVLEEMDLFSEIIVKFSWTFAKIGLLSLLIVPATVAVTLMGVALSIFGGAVFLVNALIDNNPNTSDNLGTISCWLLALGGIFSLLGLLSPVILLGSGVLVLLSGALLAFELAMGGVVLVVNALQDIDETKLSKFGTVLNGFFEAVADGLPGPLKILKLIGTVAAVTAFVTPLAIMMSLLGAAIKDFASLNIPDEWNPKTGKATHYKQLDSSDFSAVISNVSLIVDTFATALDSIYKNHKTLIDEAASDSIFSVIMGKPKSPLLKTIRMANMLGRCIGTLAESLSNIAKLMIPDKWNNEGKPIHFRTMGEQDFADAANGIKRIISTVGEALIDFAESNPTWVEEFKDDSGFLGLSSGKSTFGAVLKMSIGMGDMISKIAQSISDYAQMKIPTGWDSSGNPKGYRKIVDDDFKKCAGNIKTIMEAFGQAIKEGYENGYSKKLKSDNIEIMFNTITNATDMLTKVAETLQKMSTFTFETESGTTTLNDTIIQNAADRIKTIMEAIPTAILEASKSFTDENLKKMSNVINSLKPMGELISSLVESIQNYANLRIPTKYNSEGKAIEFRPINLDESLSQMAINLKDIMIGMGQAIAQAYKEFKSDDKLQQNIGDIISAMEPIGNVFSNLIGAVQDYANLKLPASYKADGSVASYKTVNDKDLDTYFSKMKTNLSSILKNMMEVFDDQQVQALLKEMSNEKYNEYYNSIENSTKVIKNIIETIKSYSELKIPKNFNKDGSVKSYEVLKDTSIQNMKANMTEIICAIPQAVLDSYDIMLPLNDEEKIKIIQNIIKNHSNAVLDSCSALVTKYNGIKTTIKDSDMKGVIGGFIHNIAEMYIDFVNTVESINNMPSVSIKPIEDILECVEKHTMKTAENHVKKFDKEASALEKFTKSVERINTAKLDKLRLLFETMEKWSESVGNLDEFTKALANELAGTLAKLTDEIQDAKKVIKISDEQRVKRQKQLNESIEKIDKLMKQTLHVNVSQQKGNTITSAWEKPND